MAPRADDAQGRGCAGATDRRPLGIVSASESDSTGSALESLWPAPAKLNLFLHVTGRRSDGYHDLQTLFQLIDLCDSIGIAPREDGRIERVAGPAGVAPEDDLMVRAASALKLASGSSWGASLRLVKRIPIGGGLGGGSSDAA